MIVNNVRPIAQSQGLTIQTLSQKAGVGYGTARSIWLCHTERIDFGTLDRLCEALGVGVGDLFQSRTENMASETTKPTR